MARVHIMGGYLNVEGMSGGYPDQGLPGDQPGIDNSLPGMQPGIDNSLPKPPPSVWPPPVPAHPIVPVPPGSVAPPGTITGRRLSMACSRGGRHVETTPSQAHEDWRVDNTRPGSLTGVDNTLPRPPAGSRPPPSGGATALEQDPTTSRRHLTPERPISGATFWVLVCFPNYGWKLTSLTDPSLVVDNSPQRPQPALTPHK